VVAWASRGKYLGWVARTKEGIPAAVLIVEPDYPIFPSGAKAFRILRLDTLPEHQGNGIASGLVATCAQFAKQTMGDPIIHAACNPATNPYYSDRLGMYAHPVNGFYLADDRLNRVAGIVSANG
jgi:GNAT superfamily N-acetyltransferase